MNSSDVILEPLDETLSNWQMIRKTIFQLLLVWLTCTVTGCATSNKNADSNFLPLGGDQLYYEVSGDGFPVVMVSGGSGMDLRQWDRVAPALAGKYQVIKYDPRGIGRSDNPSVAYSDTADLEALLNHLALKRVALIGLSSAGGFALEFSVQYPERVAGIVASSPFIPEFQFSHAMLTRLEHFNSAAQTGRDVFLDAMFEDPHFIPSPLDPSVRLNARDNMGANYDKGAGFDPSLPIPMDPPLINRLTEIRSPTLLLAGELDHPEVLRRNVFLLESISQSREQIITQAGHNTPLENPDAFLKAIDRFLQQVAR